MKFESSPNGILDITEGIIAHQVNCCNAIGAGVSKAIISKWPRVSGEYHEYCKKYSKDTLFGQMVIVEVSQNPQLFVANIFSQKNYGNSSKTGIVYTDMNLLTNNLKKLENIAKGLSLRVYVPDHIGCGLAGGDWQEFIEIMKSTNIVVRKKE